MSTYDFAFFTLLLYLKCFIATDLTLERLEKSFSTVYITFAVLATNVPTSKVAYFS